MRTDTRCDCEEALTAVLYSKEPARACWSSQANIVLKNLRRTTCPNCTMVPVRRVLSTYASYRRTNVIDRLNSNDTTLTHLDERLTLLGDRGATEIANALKTNRNLRSLRLRGVDIGSKGATALGQMLVENTALTTLDLRGNQIEDAGAEAIAAGLASRGITMQEVDLWSNQLGDRAADAFGAAMMDGSLEVHALNLGDNGIVDVRQLAKVAIVTPLTPIRAISTPF